MIFSEETSPHYAMHLASACMGQSACIHYLTENAYPDLLTVELRWLL